MSDPQEKMEDPSIATVVEVVDRFLIEAEKKQPGISVRARGLMASLKPGAAAMPGPEQVEEAVAKLRAEVQAAQMEVLSGEDPVPSGLSSTGLPELVEELAQKWEAKDGEGLDALIAKMEKRFEGLTGAKERAAEKDAALTRSVQDSIARSLAAAGFKGV